jgi:hypothetical protein
MQCKTFSHIGEDGEKVYKSKKAFDTLDDAILQCKIENAKSKQISKLVSYKCKECHKYHMGRNGKTLTQKYKDKLNDELGKIFTSRSNRERYRKGKDLKNTYISPPTWEEKLDKANFKVVGKIDLSKIPKK